MKWQRNHCRIGMLIMCVACAASAYEFRTAGSVGDVKAAALLGQMTLREKIGQMVQVDLLALADKEHLARYAIGSVLSGGDSDPADISPKGWADTYDELQRYALKSRLKIPIIYGIDAVHGHNNVNGAVIFPHNIGLGATRNPRLVEQAARITATEVAATGIDWTFAPAVSVVRDERWGRTYEGFSEDPELVAELGAAAVRGFQSRRLSGPTAILACAKHYLGDGGTAGGKDQGDTVCDEATLRKLFLPPYQAAVKAGVGSVMVSFSSWNGLKMHANRYLITEVLKGELGFQGIVISDWAAINQLPGDYKDQIRTGVNAGIDMFMIPDGPPKPNNYVQFIELLEELVREGQVPEARIDDAVRRILRIKFELGLFERPFADRKLLNLVGSAAHRKVARECVRQSLVLLKNDRNVLPLPKKTGRIHVAGTAANDIGIQCGGWTITWQGKPGNVIDGGTTILQAIRRAVHPSTTVTYDTDAQGAPGANFTVVVLGEKPYAEGVGDRQDLSLPESDLQVLRNAKASGAPVVFILLSGRPLILGEALELCDALIAAWLPGTEGDGVADVLFGDYNPTGKLPCSWPRTMSQVPINVGDKDYDPLFPFGYGLRYTQKNAKR
ncbi:MAG: glycoside hydrolase family 3 C-terminal domain-containing protein [Verrucomicrobiae bacterium]|nr:glycoside hydrolase family 3 C-terminal domain-containing protein [Verrucomicrobiae bacterium]